MMGKASRTFSIPLNSSGDAVNIELHEPALTAENLWLTTWGSSFILANRLHRFNIHMKSLHGSAGLTSADAGINVLELGAGTGLVGISAAAIWRTKVVLSDLAPIVPGLAMNISANNETLSARGARAYCGTLDWASPDKLALYEIEGDGQQPQQHALPVETNKATIILAADTVYSEEHPVMLSNAILAWLKRVSGARAIIAYAMRVAYLDQLRELWELLERGGLEAIDEGREVAGDDWDDETLHEWSVWRWRTEEGHQ
jgi:predicted nicotinamide N-methyase